MVCRITAVAASPRTSSGKASARGKTTRELRVEALNVTARAVTAGNAKSCAANAPINGASNKKPTYTGISGNSTPISRTTEVICELMTTNSTSAIAGTGSQAQASFHALITLERRARNVVSTASIIGSTINSTNASANGSTATTTADCAPSMKPRYTGSSTSCSSNSTGVAANISRESPLPMWVNTTT